MAVVRFRMVCISRADARMCAVVVGCPRAVIMSERIAVLKGFRSLFAADSAGLVIDRFFCAGCSRFQVLFFCLFCREVMRQKITVLVQRNLYMRRFSGRRRCKIRCGQRIDCNVVPGASDLCFGLLCVPLAGHGRLYGHVCR